MDAVVRHYLKVDRKIRIEDHEEVVIDALNMYNYGVHSSTRMRPRRLFSMNPIPDEILAKVEKT